MSVPTEVRAPGRRALPWLAAVAGFVLVALALGSPAPESRGAYDPDSTSPFGARALVLLLESFGADVVVSDEPYPEADVAFMFNDVVPPDGEAVMRRWVDDGGTLVVADPFSVYAPTVALPGQPTNPFAPSDPIVPRGDCSVDVLVDLRQIEPGGSDRFEVPDGTRECVADDLGAFVVVASSGAGTVVSLGGPDVFVNDRLDEADNATLAVRLLAPEPGTRVAILEAPSGFDSGRDLTDAIPVGTRWALAELLVVFGFYAWYRGRRLGAPIAEPQPVQIAGSELVVAVGNLLQLNRNPDQAARMLRADVRHRLCVRLGLPRDSPAEVIADVVAARTTIDRQSAHAALADQPVTTDVQLLELAGQIDRVRKEVLHGI